MRNDGEMMELILGAAREDERIRAVCMNGSRVNGRVKPDPFQDYDVVYLVTEMDSFLRDAHWVDKFGERIIMQTPDAMTPVSPSPCNRYAYLMLFTDGNRIDLQLRPVSELAEYLKEDGLTRVLLDKDGITPSLGEPSDRQYHVKPPTQALFSDCCNEFWWVSPYVVKGLRREEFLYAADHLSVIRKQLRLMLRWRAGVETGFSVSTGKNDKYLEQYLPREWWERLTRTFDTATPEACWRSLFAQQALFRDASHWVADRMGFIYPAEEDQRVTEYTRAHSASHGFGDITEGANG